MGTKKENKVVEPKSKDLEENLKRLFGGNWPQGPPCSKKEKQRKKSELT